MTLLARSDRPTAPARLAGIAAAALCAGLLAAGCRGPAAHLHADGRPGASRLSATSPAAPPSGPPAAPHAAPTAVPPTTPAPPAPLSSAPAARPPAAAGPSGPAPAPAPSTTGVAGPAPLAPCSTAALRVSVGSANGAAGSVYYPLEFTNVSGVTCGMYGFPGVSFVTAPDGSELGVAAVRNSTFEPSVVNLAPRAVAHASVQVVVAQSYPKSICRPVTAHWLRVYPPGQFTPLYAGLTAVTCRGPIPSGSTLGIYVVRPGANGP